MKNFKDYFPPNFDFKSFYIKAINTLPKIFPYIPVEERSYEICNIALKFEPTVNNLELIPLELLDKKLILNILQSNKSDQPTYFNFYNSEFASYVMNYIPKEFRSDPDIIKLVVTKDLFDEFPSFKHLKNLNYEFLYSIRYDLTEIFTKMVSQYTQVLRSLGRSEPEIKEKMTNFSQKIDSSRIGNMLVQYANEIGREYPSYFISQSLDVIVEMINQLPETDLINRFRV